MGFPRILPWKQESALIEYNYIGTQVKLCLELQKKGNRKMNKSLVTLVDVYTDIIYAYKKGCDLIRDG